MLSRGTSLLLSAQLLWLLCGESSAAPVETKRCVPQDSPAIASTLVRGNSDINCGLQNFSCGTESACCRYHWAQLTCDEENVFTTLPCICSSFTRPFASWGGVNPAPVSAPTMVAPVPVVAPVPAPFVAPVLGVMNPTPLVVPLIPPPAPATGPSVVPLIPPPAPATGPSSCANGSVWHRLDISLTHCVTNADCAGIRKKGKVTCCKEDFCWCDTFSTYLDCV